MVRPFRYGDIFLVQRLSRHAANLNIVQASLHRQSGIGASLSAILPWNHGKITTYILSQHGNRLAKAGYVQVSKRPNRPELDIIQIAPGLDARRGHPAIWEKLLTFYMNGSTKPNIERIFADVADQPLPVQTFTHAGFRVYDRQSIWRLTPQGLDDYSGRITSDIRPRMAQDEWPLEQLYLRNVPKEIQAAEGIRDGESCKTAILDWWAGGSCYNYVLEKSGEVKGSIQIVRGARGIWIQPWFDFTDPDTSVAQELLRFAVTALGRASTRLPAYVAVREYHGALGRLLADYDFAPVTDRAMMVKHVRQWVREAQPSVVPVMETAPTVATMPFDVPRLTRQKEATSHHSWSTHSFREDIARAREQAVVSHVRGDADEHVASAA